ncbi:MAG: hypothetical protein QG635_1880, partial [Bacteroidota bacterium]|nr:hypothetical protein [Bacteroidota bacterium]
MKIKLAFPDNPVFARLIKRKEEICREYDVEIYPVNEVQTSILMLQNRVDAAFLTPLGFGMGVTKIDYRIIPGMAFAAQGFTKLASVFFKKNLFTVEKCVSPHPDDFLTLIGKLLLAERYGIIVDLQKSSGSIEDMLVNADCVISRYLPGMEPAFDIGEEWSLTNDFPLPLGFWCVRAEEYPPKIIELINSLADSA